MKKSLTILLISSLILAPSLKADAISLIAEEEATTPETEAQMDEGTPVGQASDEGLRTARRHQWQNIAIAGAAVALAVTALLLVANNDGRKK